jgi:hypothetical protein
VLAIQDPTELDFSGHRATSGLGQIGNAYGQGLLAHSTLACTASGVPLGLLAQAVWARPAPSGLSKVQRKRRPVAEKESAKWLAGLQAVVAGRAQAGDPARLPPLVVVSDAESDVYAYFAAPRPAGVDLLVRAAYAFSGVIRRREARQGLPRSQAAAKGEFGPNLRRRRLR